MTQHANYWVRPIVIHKRYFFISVFALLWFDFSTASALSRSLAPENAIKYVSSDLEHVVIFSPQKARSGPSFVSSSLWPSLPAKYFDAGNGIRCASVGPPGNTTEFAIKRPLRLGDRYGCLGTTFRVTRCFQDCRSAIIEVVRPLTGHRRGTRKAYMQVSSCLGVLVISEVHDLRRGIPIDAEWLRSPVGILSDPADPGCS